MKFKRIYPAHIPVGFELDKYRDILSKLAYVFSFKSVKSSLDI